MLNRLTTLPLIALALVAPTISWAVVSSESEKESESVTSSVQSKADPFGLPLVEKVQLAGSDDAAVEFQKRILPEVSVLLNSTLGERLAIKDISSMAVDPSKLVLATDATARIYFVGEGAGYHNSLGLNTIEPGEKIPAGGLTKESELIFPDASSTVSSYDPASKAVRTTSMPLLPGDFVDIADLKAGTLLDFFLIADGANNGKTTYTTDAARNPDKLQHVVSFALTGSPYLIMAFEDMLGGGDMDYNDVIFAIDIGYQNIQQLVSTPEPSTLLVLGGFLGLTLTARRRTKNSNLLAA